MATQHQATPLAEDQIDRVGDVLGRAFLDDPLFMHIVPDDSRRARELGWFMGVGVHYGHRFGEVYTTADPLAGAAVWLPPGDTDVLLERMQAVGIAEAPARLGEEAFGRFLEFMELIATVHHREMPQPHWYLMILGVEPALQGQGIGGSLIQPILARADRDGLPCYLETQKAPNVPFYRKHGFEVVAEIDLPYGPHLWTMSREPRGR